MRHTPQHGIALVLSLVILVMMLMLALPFALSQNASIQSSDQFADLQDASTARENLESLGLGIATDSFSKIYLDDTLPFHHALFNDSTAVIDPSSGADLGNTNFESVGYPLRVRYDMKKIHSEIWTSDTDSYFDLELIIEDESGKLDINGLNQSQWEALLGTLGINYEAEQLARGFINYRYNTLDGKGYQQIDQLLKANPAGVDPRPPLTFAELDRLRPYITCYGMGQGKDGHQELGNAIIVDESGSKYDVIDIHPSERLVLNNSLTIYNDNPDYETDIDDVDGDVATLVSPMPQALNINTASEAALKSIGINDMTPLVSGSERVVFKEPKDLPDNLRDRLSTIDDKDNTNANDDVESIPISIHSSGVATVRTRAQKQNRSNHLSASSQREVIAMSLSGNSALEHTLDDQVEMHSNIATRKSSMMASWPRAIERKDDNNPNIGGAWKALSPDPDDKTNAAIKAKPLPDIHDSDLLAKDWQKIFNHRDEDLVGALNLEDDVNPEGIDVTTDLVYDHEENLAGKNSFTKPDFAAGGDPQLMEPRHISFWLTTPDESVFNSSWKDKTVPIFELRPPVDNTGLPIDPSGPNDGHSTWDNSLTNARSMDPRLESGDTSKQHYLGLYYDGTTDYEHFVLRVAGETIEFPLSAFGAPFFPQDDPNTTDIDERTIGNGTHPLINPQSMNWTEHLYVYDLKPDRAYHVNVILQNSKPGGLHIIIDGLVGRELTQLPSNNVSDIRQGDHFTTPYPLKLRSALPEVVQTMNPSNEVGDELMRQVTAITAEGLQLPSAWSSILRSPADWLPDNSSGTAHGMININGEFIAYNNWTESSGTYTFRNCKRGKRQLVNHPGDQTNGLQNELLDEDDPSSEISADSYRRNMPAHAANSDVWPGGVSFDYSLALHRGGCVLLNDLGDGSTNQQLRSNVNSGTIPGTAGGLSLQVDDATDFPERGFVKIIGRSEFDNYPPSPGTWDHDSDPTTDEVAMADGDGKREAVIEIMYYRKNGNNLDIAARNLFGSNAAQLDILAVDPDDPTITLPISATVVSWEVSSDPTGRYDDPGEGQVNDVEAGYRAGEQHEQGVTAVDATTGKTTAQARDNFRWISHNFLQLYDVTSPSSPSYGSIEWVGYTDHEVVNPSDFGLSGDPEYYILNRNAGISYYGQEISSKTSGGGRGYLGTLFNPIWPAGTRVVPVHNAGRFGYLLEAGDVITLSAQQLGANAITYRTSSGEAARNSSTWQTVVRYVGNSTQDHRSWSFNSTTGVYEEGVHYRKEVRFAFVDELPELGNSSIMSVWASWGQEDFTFYDGMPNIPNDRFNATNFPFINAWADNFSDNSSRKIKFGQQDSARFPSFTGWTNNMPGTVNNMTGTLDHIHAHQPISGNDYQLGTVLSFSGTNMTVTSNGNGFGVRRQDRTGLMLIRGEVLAYEMTAAPSGNEATLRIIGRSLLGSERNNNITVDDEVLRLPFGNVARLNQSIENTTSGKVDLKDVTHISSDVTIFDGAHSFLFAKPDGSSYELVQLLPEDDEYHTAPWLRGMYNTPLQDWETDDLVIAWYPRYASALPKDTSHLSSEDQLSALLRSRSYAWLGMPMRMYGLKLEGTPSEPSVAVEIDHNPLTPIYL